MHFLNKDEFRPHVVGELEGKPWACTCAEFEHPNKLVIRGPLGVLKLDTQLARLPERIVVVNPDGKKVLPSKGRQFYVSLETFNPFHLVTEIEER